MADTGSADLAKLEYEFATNPESQAFIPLAEAYLKAGRFVEAMVVCKKGIKSHPELPAARLIMARIYLGQAKHQKSFEELENLLKMCPDSADAHLMMGEVNLKLNRQEQAIDQLKKALDINPELRAARELLLARGIDYQPRSAQAPAPAAAAPAQATAAGAPRRETPISERPTEKEFPAISPASAAGAQVRTEPALPTVASRPPRPAPAAAVSRPPPRERLADKILAQEEQKKAAPRRSGLRITIYLAVALSVGLIIYVIYTWQAGLRQKKINDHLQAGRTLFNKDNYGSYLKALDHYREIAKLDKEHVEALSRAAFICAVLVGEHGAKKDLLAEGQKYVAQAQATGRSSTLLVTARALLELYGNRNLAEARKLLEAALAENPGSGNLHTAMGLVLLAKGDLNLAKDRLLEGAKQPESATRALVGLGGWAMRRSMYREASQAYARALQTSPDHLRSMVSAALNEVLWGNSPLRNRNADGVLAKFKRDEAEASEMDKAVAELVEAVLKARDRKSRSAGLAELEALAKKYGSEPQFQFTAARELRWAGRLKEAKEKIQLALRQDSSRPDFALEEADIVLAEKDYEGTRSRAMRVQEMDAESGRASILIGDAYLGEKKLAKAIEYYKEATKFEDTEALAHLRLGDAYLAQEKPDADKAQAQYELAVPGLMAIGEGRQAAETCVKLAKIYADKQRHQEFFDILKTALRADTDLAAPYCLIARNLDIGTKDGRDQAKEYCQKCVTLDAEGSYSADCKEKLKKL